MNVRLSAAQSDARDWEARYHALATEFDSLRDVKASLMEQTDAAKTELDQWVTKAAAWDADQQRQIDQTARNTALISHLQSDVLRLESLLRDANTEHNQLQTSLSEDKARVLAENDVLAAELKELRRKYIEQAAVLEPAAQQDDALAGKHAAAAAPVRAALHSMKSVAQRKHSSPRSPTLLSTSPEFGSADVVRTGSSLTHPHPFPPSSISKCSPLPSLATTVMPSSDGVCGPSQAATSLKRPPPSPLASERTKVTRVRTADPSRQRSLSTSGAQENGQGLSNFISVHHT
ncbi:hypothetical protein B0H14DRAFT_2844863 [Mycena olivaceomarginata]|nr:hypothetical protein B0H14DRAFT_2844863 [Mycena olivaceomarginata]